jgi:hypothetical protein
MSLSWMSYLARKHQTKLERPARDKHSSLLAVFYEKKFYKIGPQNAIWWDQSQFKSNPIFFISK